MGQVGPGQLRSSSVELTFDDDELASLCSSSRRLSQRWGPELGAAVGRQLVLVQAVPDVVALHTLPNFQPVVGTQEWLATVRGRLRLNFSLHDAKRLRFHPAVAGIGGSSMFVVCGIEELSVIPE